MQVVIADTAPINYLILIGHIHILPALFARVVLPSAVREELANPKAPRPVRDWIAEPPEWLEVRHTSSLVESLLTDLGAGETAAIVLAAEIHADLLLMDNRRGVIAALQRGLTVTGTIGLLSRAANRGLVDLSAAFGLLKQTNFRYRQDVMDGLLAEASDSGPVP